MSLFRVLLAALVGTVLLGVPLRGELFLNEFLASNQRNLADQDGEFSDWIELFNSGPAAVNLAGWTLTDDQLDPQKWTLPATNLNAGSYLLIFASGKNRSNAGAELHTSFSLNADGEYLGLFPPDSNLPVTEFSPEFPIQESDISFGLSGGQPRYFNPPTPRAANGAGFANFVADTKFSHDRGFYEQPFDLVITCATPDATIRYTTNGATPTLTTGLIYSGPIAITGTKVIRAAAFKTGFQPSGVDTQTYLFPEDIFKQSPDGRAPPGWPTSWGNNVVNYGMDPDIINSATYKNELRLSLFSLPSFILVTDLRNLFDASTGIYANAGNDGRNWERPASLELINPDGTEGFQVNCGVRIRGGFSRSGDNPKHAFRFFFREEYGAPKLKYPLFGDSGTDTFDNLDLRTFQNYSWSFQGDSRGVFFRDQFSRDAQLELGHQAERGEYYHLFINGQYWGVFNTCERPEASFGETYFGGRKEDFDVIKVEAGPYEINATDGNLAAWQSLTTALRVSPVTDATYLRLQGLNPDGTPNPSYPILLDVDNLIDYMLVMYFGGNLDAPISWFLGNTSPNNFYGMRDRTGRSGGFKFFAHDAEHTLLDVNENRTGPFSAGASSNTKTNPQYFFQQLATNPQFKLRVADRIHRAFFNGGPLTVESNQRRVAKRTNEIASAVVLESARWGDSKQSAPLTRNGHWLPEVNRIQSQYLAQRSTVVLNQFRSKTWYPNVVAPSFSQHGGPINPGSSITMTAPAGSIYYTTDGSDPRLPSGEVAPSARLYSAAVQLNENTRLQARVRSNNVWSALNQADFPVIQTWTDVLITELMYHPTAEDGADAEEFEFIELKNVGGVERDLSGLQFTNGVQYTFPNGTRLAPGNFLILASHEASFTNRYPQLRPFGIYSGKLANSGERLTLIHAAGAPLFEVTWGDSLPWPAAADGDGFSLVPRNPNANLNPNDAAQWRASTQIGGSPGADDPALNVAPIVVNELLAHTDPPASDSIEIYNPTAAPVDISGWFLTDDRNSPKKFRIPAGNVVPPQGYWVFDEADFNRPGDPNAFSFSSHGDEAYLFSADASGNLTGYSDGWTFGASANAVTFGRYTNSVGEVQFPAQRQATLDDANAGPALSPVVINEFSYRPFPGEVEFVELKNISTESVPLFDPHHPTNTWRLAGLSFAFPQEKELLPGALAVVTTGEPSQFRQRWSIPDSVQIFGPVDGNLADSGERLELQRPDSPDFETNLSGGVTVVIPWIAMDSVRYQNRAPWPEDAGETGASLERLNPEAWADDPANWRVAAAGPSPGFENNVNRPPRPNAGSDQQLIAEQFPLVVNLLASATDDGQPSGALQYAWTQTGGPLGTVFSTPQSAGTSVALPGQGTFTFSVTVSDGERSASDEVVVQSVRSAGDVTFLPAGSTWRYSDLGQDLGTEWREPNFNDSSWKSGRAQLGYGDNDEATVIGFGPDSNNKYITTYFRTQFNVTGASDVTALTLRLLRDDGAAVYLNGTEVARSNLPEAPLNWLSAANSAVGGADESTFYELAIDRSALREGANVLAVEVHQNNGGSSDLGFDLALVGRRLPANTGPAAVAGNDFTVEAGVMIALAGSFADDGLPVPPGVPVFSWTKVSGPGEVVISEANSPKTSARFDVAGQYRLRFSVNDGAINSSDEVDVTVTPNTSATPVLEIVAGPPALLRFTTAPGRSYSVMTRPRLDQGIWSVFQEVPAGPGGVIVEIPIPLELPAAFYRLISP